MEPNLKSILKSLKLNESLISMALGVLVIIVVGILVVNYFKGQDKGNILTTSTSTTSETLNANTGAANTTNGNSHTVLKGESLWSIAAKVYGDGSKWQQIASANSIKDAKTLKAGQVLTIPANQIAEAKTTTSVANQKEVTQKPATTKVAATVKATAEPISSATYTVVKGDNLWNISVRAYGNGQKWQTIAQANHLANPRLIHSGNVLILPR